MDCLMVKQDTNNKLTQLVYQSIYLFSEMKLTSFMATPTTDKSVKRAAQLFMFWLIPELSQRQIIMLVQVIYFRRVCATSAPQTRSFIFFENEQVKNTYASNM